MRVLPYLKLVRAGTLFSPAADVVAGACLGGIAWSPTMARTAAASVALYAAGMVLNDYADRHRDATTRPERPLPSGQATPMSALVLGLGLLGGSLALAPSWPYYAVMAALVLAYDFGVKASPLVGAGVMGALRGLNLAAAATVLGSGAPPRVVVIAAAAYAVYIVAVTLLGILEDQPNAPRRAVVSIQIVPPACAVLALALMPHPWPAAVAGLAAIAFFVGMRRTEGWTPSAIRGSMTWLLLGTMLYTGLLCASAGRGWEATAVLAAVLPARWISRRIAMT